MTRDPVAELADRVSQLEQRLQELTRRLAELEAPRKGRSEHPSDRKTVQEKVRFDWQS